MNRHHKKMTCLQWNGEAWQREEEEQEKEEGVDVDLYVGPVNNH